MKQLTIPAKHHTMSLKPRFRDTDQVGHVNNAVYATYFESAHFGWWENIRKKNINKIQALQFILARIEINYLKPILTDANLEIFMWVSHIGTKSWTYDYVIKESDKDIRYANGRSVQVAYDYENEVTIPISEIALKNLKNIYTPAETT